ncbi:MAG: asparagine synthase (glutamine-hydrolyzing) [Burkholderiales bacterium]|nr:asparagine synthase (glutamine-hydrolyzing) [Burkholderiales bacterium]
MCGIAGVVALDGTEGRYAEAARRMSAAMRERGPDDEGYLVASHGAGPARCYAGPDTPAPAGESHFFPANGIDSALDAAASVFLAHRRLSIIDLSPLGHQPMATEDRRYWIVYNGEIYNHREIRGELERLGERFFSASDTEVLLKGYRRWGANCLGRLRGMFAFAIWDDAGKRLFCARDRIGVKPFYYASAGGLFIFASDVNAILASGLHRPAVSLEGLYHCLSFGVAPRPLTAFEGVTALEQAHWMEIDAAGRTRRSRYWALPVGEQRADLTDAEGVDLIARRLGTAVERRLVADVPVGTFMSGGIDSTTVSALAAMRHPGIKAFTLAFASDRRLDELEQARATARMHRMEHIVRNVGDDELIGDIEDVAACYEEPFYDLSPNYVISRLVAEHGLKVILNGLGGDELFAGYPYSRWEGRWRLLARLAPLLAAASRLPLAGHLADRLAQVGRAATADRYALAVRSFLTEREKRALFRDPAVRDFDTIERIHALYVGPGLEFSSMLEAVSYIDMVNYIGNHHVYRVDKFTMRFSIEGRLPFLDHDLVEDAFRLPDRFKLRAGESKWVLRRVAERSIHPSCLAAPKKGFDLPTDRWMRGRLAGFVRGKLERLCGRGLVRPEAVRRVYREWRLRARSFRGVWQLVSVELWLERFIDRAPAARTGR